MLNHKKSWNLCNPYLNLDETNANRLNTIDRTIFCQKIAIASKCLIMLTILSWLNFFKALFVDFCFILKCNLRCRFKKFKTLFILPVCNYLVKIIIKYLADLINKYCQRIRQTLKFHYLNNVFEVNFFINLLPLLKYHILFFILEPSIFSSIVCSCIFSQNF